MPATNGCGPSTTRCSSPCAAPSRRREAGGNGPGSIPSPASGSSSLPVEQDLHPHADAEHGPPVPVEVADRSVEAAMADRTHARAEVTHPRDHEGVGRRDADGVAGDLRVAADPGDGARRPSAGSPSRSRAPRCAPLEGSLRGRHGVATGQAARVAEGLRHRLELGLADVMRRTPSYRRCTWIVRFAALRERPHEVLHEPGVEGADRLGRRRRRRGSRSCAPRGRARPPRPPRPAAR